MKIRLVAFFSLLSVVATALWAQELPPIIKYPSTLYKAGNQNWMVAQGQNAFIYFANNEGLLEFNGAEWTLYPSPNETIMRSVKVVGERIYTGCYMEFGYWSRQSSGQLRYTSLSKKIKKRLIEDEQFWNIIQMDDRVLFQSFNRIYVYDSQRGTFQFIEKHPFIFRCFKINNSIYFQGIGEGLYEIVHGQSKLVCKDERILNNRIVEIYSADDGLLLQTERAGVFKLKDGTLQSYNFESQAELNAHSIFSAKKLSDGGFALGTISNGIYILDRNGKIRHHIIQNLGLSNNTVLSLNEDKDNNLWLGLDNGIDCINLQSPIRSYKDDSGYLGTVYASIRFRDYIYLGTNQGLFYRNHATGGNFQMVRGTNGQVWTLFAYNNQLFCGHNQGTFLVNGGNVESIYRGSGTWRFNTVNGHPNWLMQGNYDGLSILEKKGTTWVFRNKIEGFNISSRYFESDRKNTVYVGHEYKGIIKVVIQPDFSKISKVTILNTPKKGKNMGLAKFNNILYFAGKQGIFTLNETNGKFVKNVELSAVFTNNDYTSGKLTVEGDKMWLFTKSYIYYFTAGNFNTQLKHHRIPIPSVITNPMAGYENISPIANNRYLVGKTEGYFIINLNDFKVKSHPITLTSVTVNTVENKKIDTHLILTEEGEIDHDENNIVFNYTVPQYNRFIDVAYQYKLEGLQKNWSEWNTKTSVVFKNLEPGDYTFKVRAKIANTLSENSATYSFTILKPWYATNLALVIYIVLFLILSFNINKSYQRYYQKQREKLIEENNRLLEIAALENEKQLMQLRNEQLSNDVDAKNRELAVSTLSLIKKDELLKIIQEDLKKTAEVADSKNLKSVISTINNSLSKDDSWNTFKEAFDNVDKDFLKKIKALHPVLTPSDLKLCAYLRLNLSSKEIAPMLNISIRSVEIKRYRLRKKLNLLHDDGLVNYILSF